MKNIQTQAVLFLLSKGEFYSRKSDCPANLLPIQFDFSGLELTIGGTFKIKSGEKIIKSENQSKYFGFGSVYDVFECEKNAVEVENMEIHKLILE